MTVSKTILEKWDVLVLVFYFTMLLIVGIVSTHRSRGSPSKFFLSPHRMSWIPVGASLFSSNMGSGLLLSLTGAAANAGIGVFWNEITAVYSLLLLGWVFSPVYLKARVHTVPQFMRKRYGRKRIRTLLAMLSLILAVVTKVSTDLYAGAVFLQGALTGLDLNLASLALLVLGTLFSLAGGLMSMTWTVAVQTIVVIVGCLLFSIKAFQAMAATTGGNCYEDAMLTYFSAMPLETLVLLEEGVRLSNVSQCGAPPLDALHLIRGASDAHYPWPGVLFGLTISSVWHWCADQVMVQRALAAQDVTHAKAGTVLAGYLQLLPLFLLVFPGMIARALYTDKLVCLGKGQCAALCSNENGCTNRAFPVLVFSLMPDGLRGMMIACLLSAFVSSLSTAFNSCSSVFIVDIYSSLRVRASQAELMIVGRLVVIVVAIAGFTWISVIRDMPELYAYTQAVTSSLAPPVTACFLAALFWRGSTEKGVFGGLLCGSVMGFLRLVTYLAHARPYCPDDKDALVEVFYKFHYFHFGFILFVITSIIIVVISRFTNFSEENLLISRCHFVSGGTSSDERSQDWRDLGKHSYINNMPDLTPAEPAICGHSAFQNESLTSDALTTNGDSQGSVLGIALRDPTADLSKCNYVSSSLMGSSAPDDVSSTRTPQSQNLCANAAAADEEEDDPEAVCCCMLCISDDGHRDSDRGICSDRSVSSREEQVIDRILNTNAFLLLFVTTVLCAFYV